MRDKEINKLKEDVKIKYMKIKDYMSTNKLVLDSEKGSTKCKEAPNAPKLWNNTKHWN